jgi:hypothetical protein
MNSDDANQPEAHPSHPIQRKPAIAERLKQLQEKTGDLSDTLERIDKRLQEVMDGEREG